MPYPLKSLLAVWRLESFVGDGQGCMAILGLETSAGILAVLGPWAGLRKEEAQGPGLGACNGPSRSEI